MWIAAAVIVVPSAFYLAWRSLSVESPDTLRTTIESLKYLSIIVGSASGLVGATTQTKDQKTGRPNAAGKLLIGIIAGSLFIGLTSQAVESTLKKIQEDAARKAAEVQRGKLDDLVGKAQDSSNKLNDLVGKAEKSVSEIKDLGEKQNAALAVTNSIVEGVKTVSGDVRTVSSDTRAVSENVLETFDLTRRGSKPFVPAKIFMRITYEYSTTSQEIRDFVDLVRESVNHLEAHRDDPRWKDNEKYNWGLPKADSIWLVGPSFLARLGETRVRRLLIQDVVMMRIRPAEKFTSRPIGKQVELIGYASFKRNQPERIGSSVKVPDPSNLIIQINRTTGNIIQTFTMDKVDVRGNAGIHSLYDLPEMVLEIHLLASPNDRPKLECFTYQNDTLKTSGRLRDWITLESRRFEGPRSQAPLFIYAFKENDLTTTRNCKEQAQSVTP